MLEQERVKREEIMKLQEQEAKARLKLELDAKEKMISDSRNE